VRPTRATDYTLRNFVKLLKARGEERKEKVRGVNTVVQRFI
jgi:hypothetical protein